MKIIVLYEELAGYFMACITDFAERYDAQVLVIRKESNPSAPFRFEKHPMIEILDRNLVSESDLFHRMKSFSAQAIFCAGWSNKFYLKICKHFQPTIPIILGLDNWWNGSIKQRISTSLAKSYFSKRFDRCFVPATPQKDFAIRLGFAESRIETGAYACDFVQFNNYFLENREGKRDSFPKRFIFVGRYVEEKGIDMLWKAFSEIQNESPNDWELWCLGKGELKPYEHPKIKHFGFVQPSEMRSYIQQTGVFVLPSLFEPWGVVAHEFAAAGFPLLLSDQVGAAEFFLNETNGFKIEHGNSNNLKSVLKSVIKMSDNELYAMGENSNRIASLHTPKIWAEKLYHLINLK
jgi:glycosyltransferase involved in cell wall biosynthesis